MQREGMNFPRLFDAEQLRHIAAEHFMHLYFEGNEFMVSAVRILEAVGEEQDDIHNTVIPYDMFESYRRMKYTSKYLTHPYIEALANYLDVDIIILWDNGGVKHVKSSLTEEVNTTRPFMYLGLHGRHFQGYEPFPGKTMNV